MPKVSCAGYRTASNECGLTISGTRYCIIIRHQGLGSVIAAIIGNGAKINDITFVVTIYVYRNVSQRLSTYCQKKKLLYWLPMLRKKVGDLFYFMGVDSF